jgi:hypothetical protein
LLKTYRARFDEKFDSSMNDSSNKNLLTNMFGKTKKSGTNLTESGKSLNASFAKAITGKFEKE